MEEEKLPIVMQDQKNPQPRTQLIHRVRFRKKSFPFKKTRDIQGGNNRGGGCTSPRSCLNEESKKKWIEKIQNRFLSYVGKTDLYRLNDCIRYLIYKKNYSPEYVDFALRYYIWNHLPLHHPPGLFYVVKNRGAQDAWNRKKWNEFNRLYQNQEILHKQGKTYIYQPQEGKTLDNFMGR